MARTSASKKDVLGLDIDDSLIDFVTGLNAYRNAKYGRYFRLADYVSFDLRLVWGVSEAEVIRDVNDFYLSEAHKELLAVEGAYDALTTLAERYVFHGITARPPEVQRQTEQVIEANFGRLLTEIHYVGHHAASLGHGLHGGKADVCERIGAVAMVEDALHHVHAVARRGIPVFLKDRPWNQRPYPWEIHAHTRELHLPVTRVFTWAEVVEALMKNR